MRNVHFTVFFFFFNDTATTEIYTLSLHDALPIYQLLQPVVAIDDAAIQVVQVRRREPPAVQRHQRPQVGRRSEEHTSELQSQSNLVCRLLLEKKKNRVLCKRLCL